MSNREPTDPSRGLTPSRGRRSGALPDGGELTSEEATPTLNVDFQAILDHINTPIFVVDGDGDLVHWNRACAALTGDSVAEAMEKAEEHGVVGPAFYHDGRRSMTLAEKVVEAPESADEEYGVPRVEEVDYTLYADRSVMKDARGEDRHIAFSAAPMYDDEGDLAGVVEIIHDRTEDARRQEQLQGLVSALQETMAEIEAGNLGARVEVGETDLVDDEMLTIVESLNEMAARLEGIVEDVASEAADLQSSVEDVAETSREISRTADEQAETIDTVGEEVSQLSATVEEIASTSNEVAETAHQADKLAVQVHETSTETQEVMSDIATSADLVAEDVETLRDRITEIDEVVEVINDIAEQTNMLALNASIEAARAGEEGQGFAVVASEVKSLAEESQTRAGEIEELVHGVQADTQDTVDNLRETTERVNRGLEQVDEATAALEDIVDAVDRAAAGIEQVSEATDDQATSTEEIASMLDEAIEQAENVSKQVETVAEANREQAEEVHEINQAIERLSGG